MNASTGGVPLASDDEAWLRYSGSCTITNAATAANVNPLASVAISAVTPALYFRSTFGMRYSPMSSRMTNARPRPILSIGSMVVHASTLSLSRSANAISPPKTMSTSALIAVRI